MRCCWISVLAAASLISLPVEAQERSAASHVGCYRLQLGAWAPPLSNGDSIGQVPPSRFELTDSMGTHVFERGKPLVRPVIPEGRTPSAFWERLDGDSVRITWTDGHVGVRLRLEPDGDDLSGMAVAISDVEAPAEQDPMATALANRVACQ